MPVVNLPVMIDHREQIILIDAIRPQATYHRSDQNLPEIRNEGHVYALHRFLAFLGFDSQGGERQHVYRCGDADMGVDLPWRGLTILTFVFKSLRVLTSKPIRTGRAYQYLPTLNWKLRTGGIFRIDNRFVAC